MSLSNADLANQIQQYWADLDADRQQWLNYITGTPGGGPNGNGQYPLTQRTTGTTTMAKCPARVAWEANQVLTSPDLSGVGPHSIDSSRYNTKFIVSATSAPTVILPRAAPNGTMLMIRSVGAPVKLVAQSGGATLRNWQNHNGSAGSYALITALVEGNADGQSAVWTLDGTTGVVA